MVIRLFPGPLGKREPPAPSKGWAVQLGNSQDPWVTQLGPLSAYAYGFGWAEPAF